MTPIEKAARAVFDQAMANDWATTYGGADAETQWEREKPGYMLTARAVLTAIREPSMDTWIDCDADLDDHPVQCFTAMIDHILEGGE